MEEKDFIENLKNNKKDYNKLYETSIRLTKEKSCKYVLDMIKWDRDKDRSQI